ncbi:MAG: DUF2336 domain-containing protein [Alphaproteobacteria bacterium]|nr:DUF2336 domain-containing protein [Alphaproteobacteria bacterium]
MAAHLSQDDVKKLLEEPSPSVRAEVARKIANEIDSPTLNQSEIDLAHEVVRLMAKDVEASVRAALAFNLRRASRLPHDIALALAQDIEQVARPILQDSSVLTDDDLIMIIKQGHTQKQEAIAARPHVSKEVSDVIITEASEDAVSTLMRNDGAKITQTSYEKALTRFEGSEKVKEAIVKRKFIPMAVAERLASVVSRQLKDYLVAHHDLPAALATDLVIQGHERAVVEMASGGSVEEVEKLVAQMQTHGRLTPSIILRGLCMGDLMFFEAAMAARANVPLMNARILIHDAGRLGLETLYKQTSMPDNMFPIVRAALDVVHETQMDGQPYDRERYHARVIERVLTQFEKVNLDDFDYLISKLGDILSFEDMNAANKSPIS